MDPGDLDRSPSALACAHLAGRLRAAGLDLVVPFARSWVCGPASPPVELPTLGRRDPLCVLIGNSRALWPAFVAALRSGRARADDDHPLDRWLDRELRDAAGSLGIAHEIFQSWEPPPRRVPLQHVAHRSGMAWLSPSHLCIHPVHGPWIGLRAVIVLDREVDLGPPRPAPDPCGPCGKPCLDALAAARAVGGWRRWAAVREVCPMGAGSAYPPAQLAYHYTHARSVLREALAR